MLSPETDTQTPHDLRRQRFVILVVLFLITLLGLHLRLTTVLGTEVDIPLRADAGQYFAYAYNLRNHGVYSKSFKTVGSDSAPAPDHLRNPGYPILLTLFVAEPLDPAVILHITLFQALLSTLVIPLIFLTARILLPPILALLVALLTALSPHLINANVYILTETAAAFTGVLLLYALAKSVARSDPAPAWAWLACGLFLAAATLVRPSLQWFLIPVLGILFAVSPAGKRTQPLWLLAGFLLLMAPWWVRNLIQFDEISNGALMIGTLHHGMYPGFLFDGRPETFGFPYRFDPRTAEITESLSTVLTEIVRRFTIAPGEHLQWYLVGKPLMFWNWDNYAQGAGDVFIYPVTRTPFMTHTSLFLSHEVMWLLHWPLVGLGILGSLLSWLPATARVLGSGASWALRVAGGMILYFMALHILAAPFPRYSIPVLPILYLTAIATVYLTYRFIREFKGITR